MTASRGRGGPARTVFAGSGTFALDTLRRLATPDPRSPTDARLVGVVTAPPRPAGRHGRETRTPVHELALELGIEPVLTPERLRARAAVDAVLALEPDLIVVADYGQIVPPALLEPAHGALNLHPSRLPRHRGSSPIAATILAGDADTAVSIIRMDPGLDTGPLVAVSEPVAVGPTETAPSLERTLAAVGARLLTATLEPWLRGEIEPVPQPPEGVSLTRPLRREDGRLDPARPADVLERQVRAFEPWPGSFVEVAGGERIAVLRAAVAGPEPGDVRGRLVADDGGIALTTADGRLRLLEVKPAGGRVMPADAFLRGRRGLLGAVVRGAGATMADR